MKLLVVCSSLDLGAPLSATPAWWQWLKALADIGVELAVTAYHGRVPETPWWQAYPNPARLEGVAFDGARTAWRRLRGDARPARRGDSRRHAALARIAHVVVAPRWHSHLRRILRREGDVDAVLLISVPPNHLAGVAEALRGEFDVPVLFYDGDVPASLPHHDGFATGFRIYDGARLHEFDAVLCNSEGGCADLTALGARAVHTIHYAADPDLYAPLDVAQDIDAFFYGHTAEYREEWLRALIVEPSRALPTARFAVRGRGLGDLGRVEHLPYLSFSRLRRYIARSRLNLVVTREAHANVRSSSSMRPFELGMMGACMVANPYHGIERWYEPGREIVLVGSAAEAVERYRHLLSHDAERLAIGAAARRRSLAEHTWRHRAQELVQLIGGYL